MPSHLSLVSCDSLYGSSSFLSEVFLRCPGLSSGSSSRVVSFGFPYGCSGFSFPLSFCSVCVPGYGTFLFPTTFFPCRAIFWGPLSIASLQQFVILLPGVMLSFYFSCDSFWGTLTVFCLVPRLSFVSFSLSGLLLLCRISLVFFPGSLSPSVVRLLGFSSISSLLFSPFWLAAGLPPWLFSFRVAFLHRFLLPSPAPSLSLSWPSPSSCSVIVLCTVRSFGCGVVSTCLHGLLLLGISCSFFAWVPGCFVTRAPCCLSAVLLSSWGSHLLRSRLPPSSSFLLEFLSFAPPWLCLAISFLQFFFLWSPSGRFGVCLPWLLSLPFQCDTLSFSVYGRLVGLPGFPSSLSTSLVYLPLSFLQFVTSFPSLGALLTRSNLRYTT